MSAHSVRDKIGVASDDKISYNEAKKKGANDEPKKPHEDTGNC